MLHFVGYEVLTAVIMKLTIFWDTAPCSQYVSRLSEESITSIIRVKISRSGNQYASGG
jgi:hypothetical protein